MRLEASPVENLGVGRVDGPLDAVGPEVVDQVLQHVPGQHSAAHAGQGSLHYIMLGDT